MIVGPSSRPEIAGAENSNPSVLTDIVLDNTPICSSRSGAAMPIDMQIAIVSGDPSTENLGVRTIAIASDAAMPGAINTGENPRATTSTITVLARTTSPGFGTSERIAWIA